MSSVGCARRASTWRDQELEERDEVVEALAGSVGRLDGRVGPAPELVAVGRVDAEQFGDHEHGERRRDGVDEVDLRAGRNLVEHRAGDANECVPRAIRPHGA